MLAQHPITPTANNAPYWEMYSQPFTATATSLDVAFVKTNWAAGDTTAVFDDVAIIPIAPGTPPFITPNGNPQPVLVSVGGSAGFSGQGVGSPPLSYQWLINGSPLAGANSSAINLTDIQKPSDANYALVVANSFGSATSATAHLTVYQPVATLFNTGVDGNGNVLPDGSIDPHYQITMNPDTGSTNALVEINNVFPLNGAWTPDNAVAKWIGPESNTVSSASGEYIYRTWFDATGRDPRTLVIIGQWTSDNEGLDIRINGTSTGNPEGLTLSSYTGFTIYGTNALYASKLVSGTNYLDFVMQNDGAGYTGLQIEYLLSNLLIPPNVPPTITSSPASQTASAGDTVTFTAAAGGSSPLYYQWLMNGTPLAGQTTLTLTLSNVTAASSGFYSILVSNVAGATNSPTASLNVAFQPIPGVAFGTGVGPDGSLLAAPSVDPHYILAASADPGFQGPNAIVVSNAWPVGAAWIANGPNSAWIAPQADQSGTTYPDGTYGGNAEGNYTYETAIDLTGQNLSNVFLSGGWALDNTGIDILVNGVSSGNTASSYATLTPFVLTVTNGLVAGANIIDFEMSNAPSTPNPTGIRIDLKLLSLIAPKLQLTHTATNLNLVWWPVIPGQQLLSAPTPKGPWTPVAGAASPYSAALGATNTFYRVEQ